tara:strand:- start:101 stop:802 length:702 start_codon:yes stop_codon:yes gene_type:complete
MKLTFLDKLGIGLLVLGLSAILGPIFLNSTISFFKDRFQNNFQHITCYGENNKPIANAGIDWRGVNESRDNGRAWFKLLVSIDELKKKTVPMRHGDGSGEPIEDTYKSKFYNMYYLDRRWGEAAIKALNTMSTFYFSEKGRSKIKHNFVRVRPRNLMKSLSSMGYAYAESSVLNEIKLQLNFYSGKVIVDTPLPNAGWDMFFTDCRISEPRFFKNPNLIVPYDATKLPDLDVV